VLLFCLIAFGLCGIASRFLVGTRTPVILLLSVGTIAFLNPASLLFCFLLLSLNFFLLRTVSGKKSVFVFSVAINFAAFLLFQLYSSLINEYIYAGLPVLVGVTYLSLQFIDYLCKVYFSNEKAPSHFFTYATAVFYLPKFFSGPIASLPQIEKEINPSKEAPSNVHYGLNRLLLGLLKKLVLAESLSPMFHSFMYFNDSYPGLTILYAVFLYSLQLYFDFSGYSDMAIGVSAIWGIHLPENFNFPFRQKSWGDFWKSWHSSLTNWLWQYIFNPLFLLFTRRNTNKMIASFICAILVFSCMAVFNGVQSGFYLSAGIFAVFYFAENLLGAGKNFISGFSVFLLFSIGLIYFRCPDYISYTHITKNLFFSGNFVPTNWLGDFLAPLASGGTQHDYFNLTVSLLLCFVFLLFERKLYAAFSTNQINYIAWFVFIILLLSWGVFESGERFIYMQF